MFLQQLLTDGFMSSVKRVGLNCKHIAAFDEVSLTRLLKTYLKSNEVSLQDRNV